MKKRVFISTLILCGMFVASGHAQGSAESTMRVSVRVVSGSSVQTAQPNLISISEVEPAGLGILTIKKTKGSDLLISVSSKITLTNSSGEELKMDVIGQREKLADNSENIRYEGSVKESMINNIYHGELATTIQYL